MEDRTYCNTIRGIAGITVVSKLLVHWSLLCGLAVGANGLSLPSHLFEMLQTAFLCWKLLVNLYNVHGELVKNVVVNKL